MRVALRDDDTCAFTDPATLERVYGRVWKQVPVCLATVPFAAGRPPSWTDGEAVALERNEALVSWLRDRTSDGRVTIALHGYTHQDYPGGHEFQAAPDPERRVGEGRAYLERLLGGRISVFVPPHNALSKRGLAAVSAHGLNILGSFLSFRPSMRPWEWRTFSNFWRIRRFRAATGRAKHDRFVYPHPLRYSQHVEFGCHNLVPGTTFEELKRGFDEARAFGGDFCLATHYWEIDAALAAVLHRFLDYAGGFADVRFVRAEALFEGQDRPEDDAGD
jgi:hypothetical protein